MLDANVLTDDDDGIHVTNIKPKSSLFSNEHTIWRREADKDNAERKDDDDDELKAKNILTNNIKGNI